MENNVIRVEPIQTRDAVKANEDAISYHDQSRDLVIKMQPDYDMAGTLLQKIKGCAKAIEDKHKEITKPLDQAKKAVMDLFRNPLIKLAEAESIVKRSMVTFEDEQERIRKEQEKKLRKQAAAEEARKKKALEERAKKAEEQGKAEKAEELREKAEETHVEAPVLAPRTEKPKGIAYKIRWTAIVVDFKALPDEYKLPNMSMLNKLAQATKGKIPVAGVEFKSEKEVASRSM